jgi:hypothetical protein
MPERDDDGGKLVQLQPRTHYLYMSGYFRAWQCTPAFERLSSLAIYLLPVSWTSRVPANGGVSVTVIFTASDVPVRMVRVSES